MADAFRSRHAALVRADSQRSRLVPSPSQKTGQQKSSMTVTVGDDAVRCVLPGDGIAITRMPRNVPVEARLPVWDYQNVLVAALLVRANRAPVWTFERWINGT